MIHIYSLAFICEVYIQGFSLCVGSLVEFFGFLRL